MMIHSHLPLGSRRARVHGTGSAGWLGSSGMEPQANLSPLMITWEWRDAGGVATAPRHGGLLAPLAEIDGNLSLIECECMGQVALRSAHYWRLADVTGHVNYPGRVVLLSNRR
jgi:hypothetical protein